MFSRIFGGGKKEENNATNATDALTQLANVEDTLLKKQIHLESQIQDEKKKALQLSKQGNKRGALAAMKKAKKFEKDLGQIDGLLQTIDNQRDALHNAQSTKHIVSAMTNASRELKKAQEGMSIEDVEQLQDDLADQRAFAEEFNNILAAPSANKEFEDADLEAELRELEQEDLTKQLTEIDDLPAPPTHIPQKETKTKDNDLRALEDFAS